MVVDSAKLLSSWGKNIMCAVIVCVQQSTF